RFRRDAWRSAAAGRPYRHNRAGQRARASGAGRTLRGYQRAARRFLFDRGRRSQRGARLGCTLPCGRERRGRGAPGAPAQLSRPMDAWEAAEAAARTSYGRMVAYLAARSRDVAAAEDALGDALRAALETWPLNGVPNNPEAWLVTAARRKLIDTIRREQVRGV